MLSRSVRAVGLNHVSVSAIDLPTSVRFYRDVLGLVEVPTPRFAFPVQWMRLGDQQLHLFVREGVVAPSYHHVALDVDDFEATWERANELGIHDDSAFFADIYELPDGSVQMYLRDPAGNLIEIDWPAVNSLDLDRLPEITKLADTVEQSSETMQARLYTRSAELPGGQRTAPRSAT
jgi:catechol 2,3-dioxygenase-like lactoylglutathione lyase family enzyme